VRFTELAVKGAYLIEPERLGDERGFFARVFCAEEMRERGLEHRVAQCSISYNQRAGTLRGMHYQAAPYGEVKLVRCTRGRAFDVVVDLRPESPTYLAWAGVELSAENRAQCYVPEGVAHGFVTLSDETELTYQISTPYVPEAARGVRWNDPAIGIEWPVAPEVMSERDQHYEDFAV
jgi:dTDP-4-dehydrorhamnose 3,5-epimerase